jgi:DNA-binding transcriptional LysR family regulator
MKQEINGLKDSLSGEIRIAAIPTVLGMVASLTTPFRARHPDVRFKIMSCTSAAVLGLLENLEVDAGLTYIENEPLGKVRSIPLYKESYRLLTSPDGLFGDRKEVTWSEVGQVPLCLLTPDMQNRRIIDRALKSVGAEAMPMLTSNSIIVLYTHVKTGRWASVMPAKLAETLGLTANDSVRMIPIVDPVVNYGVGLVVPQRDPMTPLVATLVQIAREVAPSLEA